VTSLVLKRANASRPSGQWQDEDYDVRADGNVVGRIYDNGSAGTPPDMRWFWSVMVVPATPGVTNGTAATREEAMGKFRAAWEKARQMADPLVRCETTSLFALARPDTL
jgi:hypothetical protein